MRNFPTVDEVRQLPVQLSMRVPAAWQDRNGHVNVQYYQALYELGGYQILDDIGFGEDRLCASGYGMFDLEHHINYRSEIFVNNHVRCFNRIIAVTPKRFQGIYFIVNDTQESLACTIEYITAGVDLATRRTAPFAPELLAGLEGLCDRGQSLRWVAPVCGVMEP
jgi:acyl-CoA thioester hydrolase